AMLTRGRCRSKLRKPFPLAVVALSAFCTVGCGGASTTTAAAAAASADRDFAWTVESSGRAEPLSAIWGASGHDVWAAGGHGVVHSTGDGAWTTVHEDENEEYQALLGADGWVFAGGLTCAGGVCQN